MLKASVRVLAVLLTILALLVLALPVSAEPLEAEVNPPTIGAALAGFGLLLFLATVGERLSEYFIKPVILIVSSFVNRPDLQTLADYIERLVCIIPGAGMVVLVQIDIFGYMGLTMPWPWGMIITAFLVGGGANLVHDFLKAIPDGT